tara:strand:- start:804 stop:1079 length:276 start_codon:yes stop_codon:yes gene_type:complete
MTLIVAGTLTIKPGARDEFLAESRASILLARNDTDCEDFSVSPDQIDPNRVNVFEKWQSRPALDAFRNSGPETTLFSLVESFNVKEYEVDP